jgi:short-subunit dehydrogenase
MRLNGKLAVITGASSGIGADTARSMARRGASVVLMARGKEALEQVAAEIEREGGRAVVVPADVGDPEAVRDAAKQVVSAVGAPDVLVNNAGAGRFLFIDETSAEEMESMMRVPTFAAFFVTKAFLPAMLRKGAGRILNVNTPVALSPWPGALGYATARYALRGFSEALQADLHGTGIRVTTLYPGKVRTPYFERNAGAEDRIPSIAKIIPTLTSEQTGEWIAKMAERGPREAYAPLGVRLIAWQARWFPRITAWLITQTGARRKILLAERGGDHGDRTP